MFERFTRSARWVVKTAGGEASGLGHPYIGTEHLLLAMLKDSGMAYGVLTGTGLTYEGVRRRIQELVGPAHLGPEDAEALSAIGIDLDAVRAKMEQSFGDAAVAASPSSGGTRFTRRAKKVIELSLREAILHKHRYIGTEHLLLGLIRDGDGLAARAMVDSGVNLVDLRRATLAAMERAA